MQWNYETNLPVEGTYKPRGLDWDELFLSGKHHEIPEDELYSTLDHVLLDLLRSGAVSMEIEDFCLDILNGNISLLNYGKSHWCGRKEEITDADVYARIYFCDTENDIFDIILDGAGYPTSLLETFGYVEPEEESDYIAPRETASSERLKRFEEYLAAHNYPREGNVIWERARYGFFTGCLLKLSPREMKVSFTRPISMMDIESKPLVLPENSKETFAVLDGNDYILTGYGRYQMALLLHRIIDEEYYLYAHPEFIASPGPALAMDLTPELLSRITETTIRLSIENEFKKV